MRRLRNMAFVLVVMWLLLLVVGASGGVGALELYIWLVLLVFLEVLVYRRSAAKQPAPPQG